MEPKNTNIEYNTVPQYYYNQTIIIIFIIVVVIVTATVLWYYSISFAQVIVSQ